MIFYSVAEKEKQHLHILIRYQVISVFTLWHWVEYEQGRIHCVCMDKHGPIVLKVGGYVVCVQWMTLIKFGVIRWKVKVTVLWNPKLFPTNNMDLIYHRDEERLCTVFWYYMLCYLINCCRELSACSRDLVSQITSKDKCLSIFIYVDNILLLKAVISLWYREAMYYAYMMLQHIILLTHIIGKPYDANKDKCHSMS